MADSLAPRDADGLADAVRWAVAGEHPLEVIAGGSKRDFGRPVQSAATLSLTAFDGIVDYQPSELVLTAKAATPLATIEAATAAERQMLAFEPADYAPLLGTDGEATLGGALACNLSGPRRIKAGAARDHFLGVHAVSGRGERFKAGGRVVKNVTGYDVCKLLSGSYGTLALMHEVTVKVLPAPERTRTVLVFGLEPVDAMEALGAALGSAHEVSGAAHMPAEVAACSAVSYVAGAGASVSAVRVEGFPASVEARCGALRELLGRFGALEELHSKNSATLWREIRDVRAFAEDNGPLWRLSVPPASGAAAAARIADAADARTLFDWGGGLVWLGVNGAEDAGEAAVRDAAAAVGGHATLVRADAPTRAARAVFQPQTAGLAALTERLKRAFDPAGVLNPGRMYAGV
ncbi:MAG: glycolate oxidase subunit GlcE [Rhodospirillales bacterium]|nr:glycolate oxidase subunit GlcE [Rhodospirillales bacterium]